jgi:cob(I)alamin adenosyltransferase
MMKIYTRAGDDGSTGLYGGRRVSKADARIACVGAVDELNAMLGWVAAGRAVPARSKLLKQLRLVQHELFNMGARLATPAEQRDAAKLPTLAADAVSRLEREIDAAQAQLPELRNFILPGGCELAGRLHVARTTCRATERTMVHFSSAVEPVEPAALQYLNRLSDWLFVGARLVNQRAGVADVAWVKG